MLPEMFRALTEKPETLNSGEKGISPFQAFAIKKNPTVNSNPIKYCDQIKSLPT
jgi:AGCS family alanine or glycine:cation symporter